MGTIKKLYQDQLVGGSGSAGQEVYPVTSTLGVYDDENNQLQGVLDKVTTNLGLFTCGTAAATAAKTVTASKFVLMEGGSVKIKFTYANSADSPTLAIGSTAAKPIMFNGSAASASNSWGAGEIVEFFYDGTNWVGNSTSVSVSQNIETGKEELLIGGKAALIVDNDIEGGSQNLVKGGAVAGALYDLNDDSIVKEGYELGSTGHYDANPNYNSSGDLYVREDLTYETDYTGNIFCYSSSGSFLGKVSAGNTLLSNTAFVRLNWLNSGNKPYFISKNDSSTQFRIDSLDKRISTAEEELNNADDTLIMGSEHLVKGSAVANALYDLNDTKAIKENTGVSSVSGSYEADGSYKASGNIFVDSSLEYETNTRSKIFCYKTEYSNGIPYSSYLGYVTPGNALLAGTEFIRINWPKTEPTPYFASKNGIPSVQSRIDKLDRGIDDVYKVNEDDLQGKELTSTGDIIDSADWRVSQFIELKTYRTYKCNISANYYFYDAFFTYISRQNISAGTSFDKNTVSGARFMRTNAPISTPIIINEYDNRGTELLQSRQYKGRAIVVSENVNNANYSLQGVQLPKDSKVISLDFTTANSLYDRSGSSIKLISIGNGIKLERVFVSAANDNYYCQECKCNIRVNVAGNYQDIPLRLNNYGSDLFSIRLKYPVLEVADDGKSTMITPMPSALEGAYIAKDSNSFTIHNGDGSEYRNYLFANYNDVEELVDAMIDDLSEDFDVVKYACEGVSFDAIENFDKIYISKQVNEIYYTESSQIEYTGNVYYDSYPTTIKATDKGFVHNLTIGYKIDGEVIKTMYFIWDGMWVKFNGLSLRTSDMVMTYNSTFINSIKNVVLKPYQKMVAPLLSMQHQVVYSNDLVNQDMVTSTKRQQNMLAYLAQKGFVGVNFNECVSIIRGSQAITSPVYCLTFDDRQKNLWTDERIRKIFNKYRAKPTLVYVFNVSDYAGENPPSSALTREQYWELKNSGWDVISHGFCIHTGELSYAQFVNGFNKTKQKWLDWYGEDVCAYNAHGQEITDFQYYLLKNMGFTAIASGIALLGWYCNCGTTVDVQYKRVTWMDSEQSWDTVKANIDGWVE